MAEGQCLGVSNGDLLMIGQEGNTMLEEHGAEACLRLSYHKDLAAFIRE